MSVYRVTEIIGTSPKGWEEAAAEAIRTAAVSLRDLRVAEVVSKDVTVNERGEVEAYRTKLNVSFKYEQAPAAPEFAERENAPDVHA
jgi:flavin-binding protein dodecin